MFEKFRNKFPLENDKWSDYVGCFTRTEVPAKTILLDEGETAKKLFLIEKGCVRVWFNNNGKDITIQFFFENNMVASVESFIKKMPSPVTIETIEPSIVWWIHKKDLDRILEEIKDVPQLRDLFINGIFERTFDYMKHFISSIKDTPQERYLNLLKEKPEIVKRVPQHYIASYLGITTVHLSRIKGRLVREKK
jgi:CRP-like cAMP-binding protein